MTVDHKGNKSRDECRITIINTIGPMIAEVFKETKKNSKDIEEIKFMLKRLTN